LVEKLYTYGSPRAGNGKFIKLLTTPHHRCVNNNDIVAHIPPSIYFRHHGDIHYLNFWGFNRKLHGWQKTKDTWRGILAAAKRGQFFDFLTDHSCQKYSDYLKRNWLEVDLEEDLLV
jgi:triacylglycerol lipase